MVVYVISKSVLIWIIQVSVSLFHLSSDRSSSPGYHVCWLFSYSRCLDSSSRDMLDCILWHYRGPILLSLEISQPLLLANSGLFISWSFGNRTLWRNGLTENIVLASWRGHRHVNQIMLQLGRYRYSLWSLLLFLYENNLILRRHWRWGSSQNLHVLAVKRSPDLT